MKRAYWVFGAVAACILTGVGVREAGASDDFQAFKRLLQSPVPGDCDQFVDKILTEQKLGTVHQLLEKDEKGKLASKLIDPTGGAQFDHLEDLRDDPALHTQSKLTGFFFTTVSGYVFKGHLADGDKDGKVGHGDFTILDPHGKALLTYNLDINAQHQCAVTSVKVGQVDSDKSETVDLGKCMNIHTRQKNEGGTGEKLIAYLRSHPNERLLANACGPAAFTLMFAPYGGPDPAILANILPPSPAQTKQLVKDAQGRIRSKTGKPVPETNVNVEDPTGVPNIPATGAHGAQISP